MKSISQIAFWMIICFLSYCPMACKSSTKGVPNSKITLSTYLHIEDYAKGEIKFEYFIWPVGDLCPTPNPGPPLYEATIRGDNVFGRLPDLVSCEIQPSINPSNVDTRGFTGSLTITLEANPPDEMKVRRLKLLFFGVTTEVWFDGKFWNIDDSFWRWLSKSFPFSGIDMHLRPEHVPSKVDRSPYVSNKQKVTLDSYLNLDNYMEGVFRFEYYGGLVTDDAPTADPPPPPYVAIVRGMVPHGLHGLIGCAIAPSANPCHVDLGSCAGELDITMEPSPLKADLSKENPLDGIPRRRLKLLFFNATKQVWFDERFWDIDDGFWTWMKESFPFSGIDIHCAKPN